MSEKVMKVVFAFSAMFSVAAVAVICIFLLYNGVPAMREIGFFEFIGGKSWKPTEGQFGIFPMIVGSVYMTGGAIVLGVPVALLCAVFMTWFCPASIYRFFKPVVDLLAGIPSIVYGFFGLMVIVPVMGEITGTGGKSILTGSVILAVMILPTVINVAESSIRAVPESYYEGSMALGATHEKSVFSAVLPAARSGLTAGVVAGNQTAVPGSLLSGVRTMTANIVLEMGYAGEGLHRDALVATAVVLMVFVLIINLSFSMLKKGDGR